MDTEKEINQPWRLTITRGQNGYALIFPEYLDDGTTRSTLEVVEERDSEDGEIEAMEDLLYRVKEYFGMYGSKHDKKRLFIKIEEQTND